MGTRLIIPGADFSANRIDVAMPISLSVPAGVTALVLGNRSVSNTPDFTSLPYIEFDNSGGTAEMVIGQNIPNGFVFGNYAFANIPAGVKVVNFDCEQEPTTIDGLFQTSHLSRESIQTVLAGLNTGSATSASRLFTSYVNDEITEIDLSGNDLSKVTNFSYFIYSATVVALAKINFGNIKDSLPASAFDRFAYNAPSLSEIKINSDSTTKASLLGKLAASGNTGSNTNYNFVFYEESNGVLKRDKTWNSKAYDSTAAAYSGNPADYAASGTYNVNVPGCTSKTFYKTVQ